MSLGKLTLILSENEVLRERVVRMLCKTGYSYLLESDKVDFILKLLKLDVHLAIIDIDQNDEERVDLIELIKNLRPKLPIITILNDLETDKCEDFLAAGARFCLLNMDKDLARLSDEMEYLEK